MHRKWQALALSAGLGAVTGMRSFTGLATASRRLADKAGRRRGSTVSTVRSSKVRYPLTLLAAGELLVDKSSLAGDRTDPPALFGRAAFGALCGVVVADYLRTGKLAGAAVGASAAVASTYLAFHARKLAVDRLGVADWLVALAEDAAAVAAGSTLASMLIKD